VVQLADFTILADNFGRTDADRADGDLNGDGAVDFADFVILANSYGQSRPRVAALTLPANWPGTESLPAASAHAAATDEVFQSLDDELPLG
jgi:hypothetical protein